MHNITYQHDRNNDHRMRLKEWLHDGLYTSGNPPIQEMLTLKLNS